MNRLLKDIRDHANSFFEQFVKRCPKTGSIVGVRRTSYWGATLLPLIGLAALIWFLVRVVPKPSRAAYPCQRLAAGISSGFVAYLLGALVSLGIYRHLYKYRGKILSLLFIMACVLGGTVSVKMVATWGEPSDVRVLTAREGTNAPMGQGQGLHPGRVAWMQDFSATSWDGENGNWWTDDNTNQQVVNAMFSKTLEGLTGKTSDTQAWDAIFCDHNKTQGRGERGYREGETIAIKINCNTDNNVTKKWENSGYPSPHVLNALVCQLIETVGVKGEHILIVDPSRFINVNFYNKIRSNASDEFKKVRFVEKQARDLPGYESAQPDPNALIHFPMPDGSIHKMCFPTCYTQSTYLINYALVRAHRVFGITSVAKNHFGAVWDFDKKAFHPGVLHAYALWDYPTPNKHGDPHSNPVLLGHQVTQGKTLLYMADGLYTGIRQTGPITRWSSMNNDWFSSVLMSQDPVALESVVYDFIVNEKNITDPNPSFNGHQDSQLHEAALADRPPSGTQYDPENDGTYLQSLGVHEHWNNPRDKQYSRNLGKEKGIELVTMTP